MILLRLIIKKQLKQSASALIKQVFIVQSVTIYCVLLLGLAQNKPCVCFDAAGGENPTVASLNTEGLCTAKTTQHEQ